MLTGYNSLLNGETGPDAHSYSRNLSNNAVKVLGSCRNLIRM